MSLIKCPNCEKEISENSISCFHCGYKIVSEELNDIGLEENKKNVSKSNPKKDIMSEVDYNKIGKASIVTGLILWAIGLLKILVYYPYYEINTYTYSSEYDFVINGLHFIGLSIMGGVLIIIGIYFKFHKTNK